MKTPLVQRRRAQLDQAAAIAGDVGDLDFLERDPGTQHAVGSLEKGLLEREALEHEPIGRVRGLLGKLVQLVRGQHPPGDVDPQRPDLFEVDPQLEIGPGAGCPGAIRAAASATAKVCLWLIEPMVPGGNCGAPRASGNNAQATAGASPRSASASRSASRPAEKLARRTGPRAAAKASSSAGGEGTAEAGAASRSARSGSIVTPTQWP